MSDLENGEVRARAIEFSSVSGGYRRMPVFKDISFTIREGSMSAIIGPNGSGKTTLLRAVTGLLENVSGKITLFGEDVRRMPSEKRAAMVGVVPQETFTPMAYSVEEIVMMGRTASISRWSGVGDEDRKLVDQAMAYTGVAGMRKRAFTELSGGERQRVIIAMVLAQQPRIILMDEATSHLDINHRLEIMQIIERLNREQGVTVLMVSHDLNMAAEFCERLLLLDGGNLAADGRPDEVLTAKMLQDVYRCSVDIEKNKRTGSVMVVPSPRAPAGDDVSSAGDEAEEKGRSGCLKAGCIQVYTGDGKGKTTAATGLAVRAAGAGLRVYIGQFIKSEDSSEMKLLRSRCPEVTIEQFGAGGFIKSEPSADDLSGARLGVDRLKSALCGGEYDVVIADEINGAHRAGIVSIADIDSLLDARAHGVEFVLTGRNASRRLIERADLVTEMCCVKHFMDAGVFARKGIEF